MAKIKYDTRNVEDRAFKVPVQGLYRAKIDSIDAGVSKSSNNPQLTVQLVISKGEYQGARLWHYVPTDEDAPGYFRMQELVKALGLKPAGTIDTDRVVGKEVQVRTKDEMYNGERRAKVGALIPAEDDEEDLGDEEPEDDASGNGKASPEADDADADGDADGEDDYDEWEVKELKAELKERKLRTAGGKSVLIERLRADDSENGGDDDDDPFN